MQKKFLIHIKLNVKHYGLNLHVSRLKNYWIPALDRILQPMVAAPELASPNH